MRAKECHLCNEPLDEVFIDGATRVGPWAIMCILCHSLFGTGFGVGRATMHLISTGEKVAPATYVAAAGLRTQAGRES